MFSCDKASFERVRTALRLQETYIEPETFFMLNLRANLTLRCFTGNMFKCSFQTFGLVEI